MIGVIPSSSKTYEVLGDFNVAKPIEGKLYFDPTDNRLYYYSRVEIRSCPATGYFPIWNGSETFVSKFSKEKYLADVIMVGVYDISNQLTPAAAKNIRYRQRRSLSDELLKPQIRQDDNSFTQCVKAIICQMDITLVDLVDMAAGSVEDSVVINAYNSLSKISFMRLSKWDIWMGLIFHYDYQIIVYKGNRKILTYTYSTDSFDTGIVNYQDVIRKSDDCLKKCVKILMVKYSINKSSLKKEIGDDYTVNNMMTTINSSKPLSAQLFSRFIHMNELNYRIRIYDANKNKVFQYDE